ncbi:hypothetical protein NKH77_07640 [Streptomyces sp. M19]
MRRAAAGPGGPTARHAATLADSGARFLLTEESCGSAPPPCPRGRC